MIRLLDKLKKKYKIKKQNILGHSDISPDRKKDPGEKFPWKKLAKKKLCKWHTLEESKIKFYRYLKLDKNNEKLFFKNLSKFGYSEIFSVRNRYKKIDLIKAFQRRFRQSLINGKIDKECLLISQNLLKN